MRVLVTGGAGFIGSHLVDRLIEQGCEVVAVDNLAVGRLTNLEQHRGSSQLSFHAVDIADHAALEPLLEGVERVFHLAGLADIVPSVERPTDYFRANVDGTVSVLEAARKAGVRKLVYAASSSCYGLPETFPTAESAPASPQYPYALTKYLGEQCVMHWGKVYHMPVVSLRLFNVFGPRARTSGTYGAVFGVFLAQKLAGRPLTVVGSGEQTRDFTFVADVVEAFLAAGSAQVAGQIYNVGSGGTYSVNHLAALLGGETTRIPHRPGEPECTFADISKIRAELAWEPRVPFEEGVARVLARIEDWRDAPVWSPESIAEATRSWFEQLAVP